MRESYEYSLKPTLLLMNKASYSALAVRHCLKNVFYDILILTFVTFDLPVTRAYKERAKFQIYSC